MVTVFLSAALGSPLLETDIDQLSIFRFYSHPELAPKIEAMKGELTTYLDLIADIKPLEQRRNAKTKKDTFDLHLWWREILAWGALCSPTRPREFRSRPSAASPSSTTRSTTIRLARAPTTLSTRFSHNTMRAVGRECECSSVMGCALVSCWARSR